MGLVLLVGLKVVQFGYVLPEEATAAEFYVFPFDAIPKLGNWITGLLCRRFWLATLVNRATSVLEKPGRWLLGRTPAGYFIPGTQRFFSGHLFATGLAALAFGFYLTAGGTPFEDTVRRPWASLIYILMYLTVLTWVLSAATFFPGPLPDSAGAARGCVSRLGGEQQGLRPFLPGAACDWGCVSDTGADSEDACGCAYTDCAGSHGGGRHSSGGLDGGGVGSSGAKERGV